MVWLGLHLKISHKVVIKVLAGTAFSSELSIGVSASKLTPLVGSVQFFEGYLACSVMWAAHQMTAVFPSSNPESNRVGVSDEAKVSL